MKRFDITDLAVALTLLADHQARADIQTHSWPAGRLDEQSLEAVVEALNDISASCKKLGFFDSCAKIRSSITAIVGDKSEFPLTAAVKPELRGIQESIWSECGKLLLLRIPSDLIDYLTSSDLLGSQVVETFPSSVRDIHEAGLCIVAGRNTAAVFHLMRAAEIALRALAHDRQVTYPNSSVDEQQCGKLIMALDAKLSGLRAADKRCWPSEKVKNAQIRFYHLALIEFRSFNEAWRKHVCHAGAESFYDRDQAISIFDHVSTFMIVLSQKISEHSSTPEFWATD